MKKGKSTKSGKVNKGGDNKQPRSKRLLKPEPQYPGWVCYQCALDAGAVLPEGHIATFHVGICGICGKSKVVTEPRDYNYPDFKKQGK